MQVKFDAHFPHTARFYNGQRIRVDHPLNDEREPLRGRTGTVVRLLKRSNDEAWIKMNEPLPDGFLSFPVDDPHGRGQHILMSIEECEELATEEAPDAR